MSHTQSKDGNGLAHLEQAPTATSTTSSDHGVDKQDVRVETDMAANEAEARGFAANWVDGSLEEKRLVRKLDWRILPCTWILYLLGFLDRANIGYFTHHTDIY